MRARVGALLGYLALTLLCVGAVASIPGALMSVEQQSASAFSGLFVVGVWLAAILTKRAVLPAALVGILSLAGGISLWFAIQAVDLKELLFAFWFNDAYPHLFGALIVNPVQFWAFLLGAVFLIAGLWVGHARGVSFGWSLPTSLLVAVVTVAAIDIVGSILGLSRVLDATDLLLLTYLLPMAASAIAVMAWLYVTTQLSKRRKAEQVG